MDNAHIRASDADRERVVDILQRAYLDGRIDREEHDERVHDALSAKTLGDLLPLTADLVPPRHHAVPPQTSRAVPAHPSATDGGDIDRLSAMLSTVKRQGAVRVHARSVVTSFLGSVDLDLTGATFASSVVEINITQLMGTFKLRVPLGTTVRDQTTSALGSTSIRNIGTRDLTRPTIVITGSNILGEVKVRGPRRMLGWPKALT